MEYRTLSGYFLLNDDILKWVYQNTMLAINFVNNNGIINDSQGIIDCINNCDKEKALQIIEKYKINILNYIELN